MNLAMGAIEMTKRIKFEGWTPYMTARVRVSGYRPSAASRFAVARVGDRKDAPWRLIHVRSGMPVDDVLPLNMTGLADKLAVAAAWEALTHCDWTAFDTLEELGEGFNGRQHLDASKPGAQVTVAAMREAAARV